MQRPGFTLVETVIVILFLSLSLWGGSQLYDWYVRSARADDAKLFVETLANAQRDYFKIHGRFLPLSQSQTKAYPASISSEGADWKEGPELFQELGIDPPETPLYFRVAVLAGVETPPLEEDRLFQESSLSPYPKHKTEPWFYIIAFADQDKDGEFSRIEVSSWHSLVEHERTE